MTDHSPEHASQPDLSSNLPRTGKDEIVDSPAGAADDLHRRWLPSPEQVTNAQALLQTVPPAERSEHLAVVPLAQPGKTYGFWDIGQPVVCLPGVWLGNNAAGATANPLFEARTEAEKVAQAWLNDNDLPGTIAVAYISEDGHAAVFEGLPPSPEAG